MDVTTHMGQIVLATTAFIPGLFEHYCKLNTKLLDRHPVAQSQINLPNIQ